jgi:hypothetical protein
MINDSPLSQFFPENGNPIRQYPTDNLARQQPSSDNVAQFIRMLGNLSSTICQNTSIRTFPLSLPH